MRASEIHCGSCHVTLAGEMSARRVCGLAHKLLDGEQGGHAKWKDTKRDTCLFFLGQSTRKSGEDVSTGTCGVLREVCRTSSTPRRAPPPKKYNKDRVSIRKTVRSDSFAGLITHGFTRSDQRSEERIVNDIMNTAEQRPNTTVAGRLATLFNKASHNVSWSTSSWQIRGNPIQQQAALCLRVSAQRRSPQENSLAHQQDVSE